MLRLASDADVHGEIIRGLTRRRPDIDLNRVQDFLPDGTPDDVVLDWVVANNRYLITNDRNTMIGTALDRATKGQPFTGMIVTTNAQSIGGAISDILLIAEYMSEEEIRSSMVLFLPLWKLRTV